MRHLRRLAEFLQESVKKNRDSSLSIVPQIRRFVMTFDVNTAIYTFQSVHFIIWKSIASPSYFSCPTAEHHARCGAPTCPRCISTIRWEAKARKMEVELGRVNTFRGVALDSDSLTGGRMQRFRKADLAALLNDKIEELMDQVTK